MADVLALIPARAGSKGIPKKNFTPLAGVPPYLRAMRCACAVGARRVVLSTDALPGCGFEITGVVVLQCEPPLHTDDCAMIDVVKDTLARVPGPPDEIILLVQPTQPLRQPKHLRAAIELLESSGADSVVSVVELPRTHHPEAQITLDEKGWAFQWRWSYEFDTADWLPEAFKQANSFDWLPAMRQELAPTYIRDGTVYAFRRSTVATYRSMYGKHVKALIIPPEETCALDTPADWAEAERRLNAKRITFGPAPDSDSGVIPDIRR